MSVRIRSRVAGRAAPIVARWRPRRSTVRARRRPLAASSIAMRRGARPRSRASRSSSSTSASSPARSGSARRRSTFGSRTGRCSWSSSLRSPRQSLGDGPAAGRRVLLWISGALLVAWLALQAVPPRLARRRSLRRPPRELPEVRRVRAARVAVPLLVRRRGRPGDRAPRRLVLWSAVATAVALLQLLGSDIFARVDVGLALLVLPRATRSRGALGSRRAWSRPASWRAERESRWRGSSPSRLARACSASFSPARLRPPEGSRSVPSGSGLPSPPLRATWPPGGAHWPSSPSRSGAR